MLSSSYSGDRDSNGFMPLNDQPVARVNAPPPAVDWEAHLEALPLATWIGDSDGDNIFVNHAYRRMLGVLSVEQVADDKWACYVHPEDRKSYLRAWNQFLQSSAARFKETVRWVRPDTGQTIKLAVRAQKLSSGQFQGWVRPAHVEQALSTLESLSYVRPR